MKTLRIEDLTCCSYHTPRNAVVFLKTGKIVPKEALSLIPDSPAKDHMVHSGNMCDPCAKKMLSGTWERPQEETIMGANIELAPATG